MCILLHRIANWFWWIFKCDPKKFVYKSHSYSEAATTKTQSKANFLFRNIIVVFNAAHMIIHTHSLSSVVIVTILYISPSNPNPNGLSCKVNGFLSPFKIEHSIVMIYYTSYHQNCWHIATASLLFQFVWIE